MLSEPLLPYRRRMTVVAQGILITKYLVVRIQHTPARNLRGEMLHQDFHLTQETSWKPSSKDAGGHIKTTGLQSYAENPWNSLFRREAEPQHSQFLIHKARPQAIKMRMCSATTRDQTQDLQSQMTMCLTWLLMARDFPTRHVGCFQKKKITFE